MEDQLDGVLFTCNRCKKQYGQEDGTWLPIGEEDPVYGKVLNETPLIIAHNLRKPEVITSDEFTCYDCLTDKD